VVSLLGAGHKALEAENRRLKQIVADQALDNLALKELLSKNF
jgi:putative transposase